MHTQKRTQKQEKSIEGNNTERNNTKRTHMPYLLN